MTLFVHLHETIRQNSIQQGLPIPQKNSPPGVSRGLRRYSCRSWPLDTYSRMSSTRQFRIRQRSLRVVAVMGLLFRSLSMVEQERWWFLIRVYVDSVELWSVFQNGA